MKFKTFFIEFFFSIFAFSLLSEQHPLMLAQQDSQLEQDLGTTLTVHRLEARSNIWEIADNNQQCAVFLGLTSVWYKITDVSIRNKFKAGSYTGLVMTALYSTAVAVTIGSHSGTKSASKRSLDSDFGYNEEDMIHGMKDYGIFLHPVDDQLMKRDASADVSVYQGNVVNSMDGNISYPIVLELSANKARIAVGVSNGGTDNILAQLPSTNISFSKRDSNPWVSYNFDKTDASYSVKWTEAFNQNYSTLKQVLQSRFNSYGSYKQCMAAQLGPESNDYGYIGYQNVFKGELYIEQWGGTDSQCLDSKDGADA